MVWYYEAKLYKLESRNLQYEDDILMFVSQSLDSWMYDLRKAAELHVQPHNT